MNMENVIKDNAIRGLQSAIEISGSLVHLRKEHAKAILDLLKEQEAEISRISNAYLELVGKASKQPSVVRCKDCVKRNYDDCPVNGWMPNKTDGDWFCADGERKDI